MTHRRANFRIAAVLLGASVLMQTAGALARDSGSRVRRSDSPQVEYVQLRYESRPRTRQVRQSEQVHQGEPASTNTVSEAALAERMNANTVSVISGTPGGTYFRMASDMAFVLDDGDNLRVLPILGKGAGQNAYDVRFLKGVDLGFVRTDTLDQLRQDKRLKDVEQRIAYVAKLFNDELHVIASQEITDFRQLAGKKVSFDVKGSGTDYTGRAMFAGLDLQVEAINVDQPTAFDLLKKGEIAAVVSVAAKPVAIVAGFDPGDRFHFVSVPYVDALADRYVPTALTSADYPRLLKPGATVDTLAVGTVLAAYNWPRGTERYSKIARFIDAFFSKFDKFTEQPRHPKWREVNIAAGVPGWRRFPAAEEWLDSHPPAEAVASQSEFQAFLHERPPAVATDKDRLYAEYLKWRRERELRSEPRATGATR